MANAETLLRVNVPEVGGLERSVFQGRGAKAFWRPRDKLLNTVKAEEEVEGLVRPGLGQD